jgi:hypothetical protein
MQTGKTITELAQAIEHQQKTAKDYLVPVERMSMLGDGALTFKNGVDHKYSLNDWSAGQLASFTDIPKGYFDRLRAESTDLLASNVNHGLHRQLKDAKMPPVRMLRTVDGKLRAFLSDRYRTLDSYDLLDAVLPTFMNHRLKLVNAEITERRMYLRVTSPKLVGEVQKGDVVEFGMMISNSDVGAGSLKIEPFINRLVCLNGLVMTDPNDDKKISMNQRHLGGRQGSESAIIERYLTDETKELNQKAFWNSVKDVVSGMVSQDLFDGQLEKLRRAADLPLKRYDLPEVVEITAKTVGLSLTDMLKSDVVEALGAGGQGAGLTQWGLINAFTAAAGGKNTDFDGSIELERAAGRILELNPTQWRSISNA